MKSCWIVTRDHKAVIEYREVPVPQPKPGEVIRISPDKTVTHLFDDATGKRLH